MLGARMLLLFLLLSGGMIGCALGEDRQERILRGTNNDHDEKGERLRSTPAIKHDNTHTRRNLLDINELITVDADASFGNSLTFTIPPFDGTEASFYVVKWETLPVGDEAICRLECNSSPYGDGNQNIRMGAAVTSDPDDPNQFSDEYEGAYTFCDAELKLKNSRQSQDFYTYVNADLGLTNAKLRCTAPGCNPGCLSRIYNGITNFVGNFRGSGFDDADEPSK